MFVEVLGCPVLDVGLWGGLPQGEFWENATAGTRHHIPGITTGLKLGAGSEVLRLNVVETEDRRAETCHSSPHCSTALRLRAESFFILRGSWLGLILTWKYVNMHKVTAVQQRVHLFLSVIEITIYTSCGSTAEIRKESLKRQPCHHHYRSLWWCPQLTDTESLHQGRGVCNIMLPWRHEPCFFSLHCVVFWWMR